MNKQKYASELESVKANNKKLTYFIGGLVIALILSLLLANSKSQSVKVDLVPHFLDKTISMSSDGEFNDAYHEMMAKHWMALLFNFQPNTVKYQFNEFLRFVHPRNYNELRKRLSIQAKSIIQNSSSSVFFPSNIEISSDKTTITGELIGMVGDKIVSRSQKTFLIDTDGSSGSLKVRGISEVVMHGNTLQKVEIDDNSDFLGKKNEAQNQNIEVDSE